MHESEIELYEEGFDMKQSMTKQKHQFSQLLDQFERSDL